MSFFVTLLLCALSSSSFAIGAMGTATTAIAPAFDVAIGDKRSETLGIDVDENTLSEIDRFLMPAAFLVFEHHDLVLVLDAIRNRVCTYRTNGVFLGATPLPFAEPPIDFAWFPDLKKACFLIQGSTSLGLVDGDFSKPGTPISHKVVDLASLTPVLPGSGFFGFQRIWAGGQFRTGSFRVVVSTIEDFPANLILEGNADSLRLVARSAEESQTIPGPDGKTLMSLLLKGRQAVLTISDIRSGQRRESALAGMPPMTGRGFGCRNIRAAGSDAAGNLFVEALFGTAEDAISHAEMYKFSPDGSPAGRCPIPSSPEMNSNHFMSVDAGGAVWYMKKNAEKKSIEFFRFAPDRFLKGSAISNESSLQAEEKSQKN